MNFLAHAYLSFNDPDLLAGNMISDFVKGKKKFNYSQGIQAGIALHREIDFFTDTHPATREAKKVFSLEYGLYAAVFVDVVYDHFLSIDSGEFPGNSLLPFTEKVYKSLDPYVIGFPEIFKQFYPHMKLYNWLYNYQTHTGIKRSFLNIAHRAKYISESEKAVALFLKNYSFLQECYKHFFPFLKEHAYHHFAEYKRSLEK